LLFLDPGSEIRDPGLLNIRIREPGSAIRDKHPGSATPNLYILKCKSSDKKTFGNFFAGRYNENSVFFFNLLMCNSPFSNAAVKMLSKTICTVGCEDDTPDKERSAQEVNLKLST
jgi:hypothetical protein